MISCKGEEQTDTGQGNEKNVSSGYIREGFSAYSSPVMLISRKLTKDKMCDSYFRHLTTRITKSNLAFLLVRDTFSMSGSSKYEAVI